MSNDVVEAEMEGAPDEAPKRGRKPKAESADKKPAEGIHFGLDNGAAVVIVCPYSRRREYAERLFTEHRDASGLKLTVPACGLSINYQAADRVPLGWNQCGCGHHAMIKWVEGAA